MNLKVWIAAIILTCVAPVVAQTVAVDSEIPEYKRVSGVSGNLSSVGSDTLNNLMTLWAEGFQREYPNVKIQIEGKGSSTAPPSLIQGTAQIGPMSRAMKAKELDSFEKRFGYKPTQIAVAVDALAVYVHKDNPLDRLRMSEVDAIFSSTLKCGNQDSIDTWGDAGLDDNRWSSRPISMYGRNSASGTYGYFKKVALCKGDFRNRVKEQPGSASVVQGVSEDLSGIGYSGIGYKTSGVKTLEIAGKSGEYAGTDPATVLSGKYPLSRFLYLYVNKAPNEPIDPMIGQFIRFVLSQQGQTTVVKDGYLPLPGNVVQQQLAQLD